MQLNYATPILIKGFMSRYVGLSDLSILSVLRKYTRLRFQTDESLICFLAKGFMQTDLLGQHRNLYFGSDISLPSKHYQSFVSK